MKYLLTLTLLLSVSAHAWKPVVTDKYYFLDIKTATFFNGCKNCRQPDGNLPVWVSFGKAYELGDYLDVSAGYLHRSNWDIGFPNPGESGDAEYNRDGFFGDLRLKFRP